MSFSLTKLATKFNVGRPRMWWRTYVEGEESFLVWSYILA